MSKRTPGQIAYEALADERRDDVNGAMQRWEDLSAKQRDSWEVAADAVLGACTSPAMVEVIAERARQDAQWGGPVADDVLNPDEFIAMVYKQRNALDAELRNARPGYRERFVKIAALAIAALESMARKVSQG